MVHENIMDGQALYLVQPQFIGTKWTQANKVFRSSVWDSNGELVSAAFPKFMNWGENPEHFPVPSSLKNTRIMEKIDGSLLIVSKWNGQVILRTRGTVDATKLDNGWELDQFINGYLAKLLALCPDDTWDFSFLFEWVSPNQRIILNYGDNPEWYLVGYVIHDTYSLLMQDAVDFWASQIGCPRPPCYTFPSIQDLMSDVELWKGKEGIVIYSNNGQTLHKVKSLEYLVKHRFKSEATLENTLEMYLAAGQPSYQEFERHLIESFDYECFEMVRGFASSICDASKEVQKIIDGMVRFVKEELSKYPTRKLQAVVTFQSYGKNSNRASFVFKLLDGKLLGPDDQKKLFYQVLKK